MGIVSGGLARKILFSLKNSPDIYTPYCSPSDFVLPCLDCEAPKSHVLSSYPSDLAWWALIYSMRTNVT